MPSGWPELIEVLARHAGRCLEALTTQKTTPKIRTAPGHGCGTGAPGAAGAAGASAPSTGTSAMMQITDGVTAAARRTARLLVSDIRLFHEPAVNEGRRHRNLLSRLAPEIEKARQAYNEQVPAGVRGPDGLFPPGADPDARGRGCGATGKPGLNDGSEPFARRSHEVPAIVLAALLAGVTLSAAQLVVPGRAGTRRACEAVADGASAGAERPVGDVAGAGAERQARARR